MLKMKKSNKICGVTIFMNAFCIIQSRFLFLPFSLVILAEKCKMAKPLKILLANSFSNSLSVPLSIFFYIYFHE
jgi:hypothetical protein